MLFEGKLKIVVSSNSSPPAGSIVVNSSSLNVVIISVFFMKSVNISNLSSSDILGLVAGAGVVNAVCPTVVNLLKGLLGVPLPLVVCGNGSVVLVGTKVGAKGKGRTELGL